MHRILLLGGGGREHALASAIVNSPSCDQLFVAPGNAGTAAIARNVSISNTDFPAIDQFCKDQSIRQIIVGPELPLVEGIYDYFKESDIRVLGPSKKASQLEGSKDFANAFMAKYNIPTAASRSFTADQESEGLAYIKEHSLPIVLKADGLAAGKGVLIIDDHIAASTAFSEMLHGKFGKASKTVVIEKFLSGIEFSVFILTDGKDYVLLPEAKDYKRIGEGDTGLNTGGMGSISPVPFFDDVLRQKVLDQIIEPTLTGIQQEGLDYKGFIFFGLILVDNEPYVIEYNCRMGDPETESVFPRIESDFLSLVDSVYNGTLDQQNIRISQDYCTTVFLVSGGYPEAYKKGLPMQIPSLTSQNQFVFHAGTRSTDSGEILTNGGRVIACTSRGQSMEDALALCYDSAAKIDFTGKFYRRDIGFDLK